MITSAEWRIMAIIWANQNVTATTIFHVLEDELQWSMSTVKTLLARLVKKGYLTTEKQGKTYIYSATVTKYDMAYQKISEDIQLVCRTKQAQILNQLIEDMVLSKPDVEQLITKLTDYMKTAPQKVSCCCPKGQCTCCPLTECSDC